MLDATAPDAELDATAPDAELDAAAQKALERDEHLGVWNGKRVCIVCRQNRRQWQGAAGKLPPSKERRWLQTHGVRPSSHPTLGGSELHRRGCVVRGSRTSPSLTQVTPRPLSIVRDTLSGVWEVAIFKLEPCAAAARCMPSLHALHTLAGFNEGAVDLGNGGEDACWRVTCTDASVLEQLVMPAFAARTADDAFAEGFRAQIERVRKRTGQGSVWVAGSRWRHSAVHYDRHDVYHVCLAGRKIFYVASQMSAKGAPWARGETDGVLLGMQPPVDCEAGVKRGWSVVELCAGDAIVMKAYVWHCVVSYADAVGVSVATTVRVRPVVQDRVSVVR